MLQIYVVIGLNSRRAAEKIYDRLERRAAMLHEQPRLGPRRADIRPTLRALVEGPYLILYETAPYSDDAVIERIDIVPVVDGRRDLAGLF